MSSYDKQPYIQITGHKNEAWCGYNNIIAHIQEKVSTLNKTRIILAIDCYPGVFYDEIKTSLIDKLNPQLVIFTDEDIFKTDQEITARVKDRLSDDRVFGQMCLENYEDLICEDKLKIVKNQINNSSGLTIIYGAGATLAAEPDIYVYADMARWEIQQRFRKNEILNWKDTENEDDNLKKFKWGFFFAWRVADRNKKRNMNKIDYILDTNIRNNPKMISGDDFRDGLKEASKRPFRVVPFFDPGVWGGQWMKETCGLDRDISNYAWCFDCVPEENSLLLKNDDVVIEIPSIDLVFYRPIELLGPKVYARFGAEFPIRFDFLDTMGGQNLSLQVHPLVGYAQEKFGMHYTQEESYYILDAKEEGDTVVYLGVKTGVTKDEFIEELKEAQKGERPFNDAAMVNSIPVKKHDHILIPPGTVHCSGKDTMVLEISATPYIFTFKLWDWGRLGLDGKPRPIHIEHGSQVIQFDRDTQWIKKELVNNIHVISEEKGHKKERTGLHELEFIDTVREWFDKPIECSTEESVNVLNLVEGQEIQVVSLNGEFEPYTVHYAETFIIPEQVRGYKLIPNKNETGVTGVIIARVRV